MEETDGSGLRLTMVGAILRKWDARGSDASDQEVPHKDLRDVVLGAIRTTYAIRKLTSGHTCSSLQYDWLFGGPATHKEFKMTEDTILIIVVALFATALIAATLMVHVRKQRLLEFALRERERTLLRLTERFDAVPEFIDFARSPEAQALFATMDAPAAIAKRLLAMTGVAILLLALGIGMWANALSVPMSADVNFLNEARDERWWGTLSGCAGLGLLIATAVCARLGRRWGVLGS